MEPDEYDLSDLRDAEISRIAKESVSERFEKFEAKIEELEGLLHDGILPEKDTAELLLKEIKNYHSELFEDKTDGENHHVPSIKTETAKYIKESKETFGDLENVIRSLLPGAGAIKFAKTYFEAKKRYGVLSVHEMTFSGWEDIFKNIFHVLTTGVKTLIFYFIFIAPLGAIVWMFGDIILKPDSYKNLGDLLYVTLLLRFALIAPLGAISWFGLYSIRLNRKFYEEYNHKQRVMTLYHSFDSEIKKQGTEEQARRLLDIMRETVNTKPSVYLYRGRAKNKKRRLTKKQLENQ